MLSKKGFSLIEMVVVVVIVGLLAAMTVPNFVASFEVSKAQMAKNNLYAIAAAEQKYYEDNPTIGYCLAGCGDSNANISTNLHLAFSDNFAYSCVAAAPYTCTAADGTDTLTLTAGATGVTSLSCVPAGSNCPS